MNQNYISSEELIEIEGLISKFEATHGSSISIEAIVTDDNGDQLGSIKIADSGNYAFFPRVA